MPIGRLLLLWLLFAALVVPTVGFAGKMPLDNDLTAKYTALLPRGAEWGLVVSFAGDGTWGVSAGTAAEKPLIPGSLVKLITSGAFMELAANKGRFDLRTTVHCSGVLEESVLSGSLYLSGHGNALLSGEALQSLARAVRASGIGLVAGDLVIDSADLVANGLERTRPGAAYAPAGALGSELHSVAVVVMPAADGLPPVVRVEPLVSAVRVAIPARTTVAKGSGIVVTRLDDLSYRVDGEIAVTSAPIRQRFALADPGRYTGEALRTALEGEGITVRGRVVAGDVPHSARLLAESLPEETGSLLQKMNTHSLNVMADNLLLIMGREQSGRPGTREKGLGVVNAFLASLGFGAAEATIVDGSGLSKGNRLSPQFMVRYLRSIAVRPWFARFKSSLPRPGVDGTVRRLGYGDERFRVKSGALENVYALAGYGVDRAGNGLTFAFIANFPGTSETDMNLVGTELVRDLATGLHK